MKYSIFLVFVLMSFQSIGQESVSKVWVSDNGDGSFKNPVINADYSDPDAIRVGEDFYMISSSFSHVPGIPILHSKDLVNWTIIGYALPRLTPNLHYDSVQHGGGIWAPSIRFHAGEFFIYYPDPDFGIYVIRTKNIRGPWSDPVLVEGGKGLIDPCPLWDDDGRVYLVHAYAGSRAGIKSIIVIKELNATGTKTIGNAVLVYDGHENDPTIEGPKLYKRSGYYYIFAPAGGVTKGWQLALRSKNIYGPYERKIVMDQGNSTTNGPHQGAWVNTTTGEDWFLHFQDKAAYGRVVHLQPMKWAYNWPVIGRDDDNDGKGEPVLTFKKPNVGKSYPIKTLPDGDEFNTSSVGFQWQWQANPQASWIFPGANGSLRMYSVYHQDSINNLWNLADIFAQKLPAESFIARVKLKFTPKIKNERFGLIMFGEDYAYISLEKRNDGLFVVYRENMKADQQRADSELASFAVSGEEFYLEVIVDKGGQCQFGFAGADGKYKVNSRVFNIKPGRWVGAKMGFFCLRNNLTNDAGYADIDWFRVEANK